MINTTNSLYMNDDQVEYYTVWYNYSYEFVSVQAMGLTSYNVLIWITLDLCNSSTRCLQHYCDKVERQQLENVVQSCS